MSSGARVRISSTLPLYQFKNKRGFNPFPDDCVIRPWIFPEPEVKSQFTEELVFCIGALHSWYDPTSFQDSVLFITPRVVPEYYFSWKMSYRSVQQYCHDSWLCSTIIVVHRLDLLSNIVGGRWRKSDFISVLEANDEVYTMTMWMSGCITTWAI